MLVLTRKSGERIAIGDNIVITVLEVQGKRIRLGIEAPRSISIRREELPALDADEELAIAPANQSRRRLLVTSSA